MKASKYPYGHKLEIWGGLECTINRVGNSFYDQLEQNGHYDRSTDIKDIATLGIKALRYPVLWERHCRNEGDKIDWQFTEQKLSEIRKLDIKPIVGLLHHGSGPAFTSLDDTLFPYKFAAFAKEVALQFPWVEFYTPINEPLTTARFSGLYGFWYPHKKEDSSFVSMLLNQVKAIVLAMKEIRKINPDAKLIQTEDLAIVQSTPLLQYQAQFENHRRWLTYDLLCGKVGPKHALWHYFLNSGATEEQLYFLNENRCAPEIIGCNYYATSERYLDEHIDNYPVSSHGGNGTHKYADTESVRANKYLGLAHLLKEVWERYSIPIAITEVHLNCTREQQMRWLVETWHTCSNLISEGVNIKAMTAWALLGSYDWDSLLTSQNKSYEPGVFDIRNNVIRRTALATIVSSLSQHGYYKHPVLEQKGWWHGESSIQNKQEKNALLIIGKTGTLGNAFAKICEARGLRYILLSKTELDICNESSIIAAIKKYKPWCIVNTAGFVQIDKAEELPDECFRINIDGAVLLSKCCALFDIQFMTFSTDQVFDGLKTTPYLESDTASPLNVYGLSKATAENEILKNNPSALIIRTSTFFGPWDKYNFAFQMLSSFEKNKTLFMPDDLYVSPTYIPDLIQEALNIFLDGQTGIWHITNKGCISWADLAKDIAFRGAFNKNKVTGKKSAKMKHIAKRPAYSVLESEKGIVLPSLSNALDRFFKEKIFAPSV